MRRSDQFVSTSRFSEGSVFDRAGVSKGFGYLEKASAEWTPWLQKEPDGLWVSEESLAAAPYYDDSSLVFYNGNLHNYYHWMVEGLLCLDILQRAMGPAARMKIAVPRSVDVAALIQHRESLEDLGFGGYVEVEAGLIRVREAIWVDKDLMEHMPAPYLKDFRQRVAAHYAHLRTPRNRRLLVARKGPTRTIQNQKQVEALLSRYAFETVYLEGMSTKEQVLLFQSAEFIISPHGAGLSNLLFCAAGTKVIELSPSTEFRPFFWPISDKLDLVYGLQFCATVEERDFKGFQSSLDVDLNDLQTMIRMVDAHR
jgi:capsular polysaccharide biosynthesis protein